MPPPLPTLSPAKAALLAASLASASDIPRLRRLVAARTLSDESLLQALLCLPETAPPESYSPLLLAILSRKPSGISAEDEALNIDTEALEKLSEKGARRKLRQVLPALPHASEATCEDLVTAFLTARAERIDSETGALSIVVELLLEFVELLPPVKELYGGTVEVLYRLVYEFSREPTPGLAEFRAMHVEEALEVLVVDPETVVRDLKELVEPYMAARDQGRKEWRHVWARLSALPFGKLIQVVNEWTPPDGVREDFAAWAVRICYHCTEMDNNKVWEGMHSVHRRIESLLDLEEGTVPETVGDLNDRQNPLFQPTRASLGLLDVIITSSALLKRPVSETVRLRLEGAADVQRAVLQQFVRAGNGGDWNKRDDEAWRKIRDGARWLRNKSEVFCQLSVEEVERAVLSGILAGTRFGLVRDIYVTGNSTSGLSLEDVEKCVLSAFNDFVDNASNGNKRRGSMKNALQAIQTLYPHTSTSPALTRANRLISALHALSTYTLPATHSTPLLPVQIRIHPDPVSLISKVLASNTRSYQRPDALVEIAQDLTPTLPKTDTEARVLGMCTEAALEAEDFETAYAYVSSRLLPAVQGTGGRDGDSEEAKSTLWRTALLAGRFRSSYAVLSGTTPRGAAALGLLEKKRELLAWALAYCPAEAISEVLAAWTRNEEEIDVLLEAEQRAEAEHAGLGVKSSHARRASVARGEEGPQSLFEVAKGAARVFSGVRGGVEAVAGGESQAARERKRDVVSGMVTRGLAGGLGWVLGAQPNLNTADGAQK